MDLIRKKPWAAVAGGIQWARVEVAVTPVTLASARYDRVGLGVIGLENLAELSERTAFDY